MISTDECIRRAHAEYTEYYHSKGYTMMAALRYVCKKYSVSAGEVLTHRPTRRSNIEHQLGGKNAKSTR